MKKFLTIAGSDASGGAGIQADIRTATLHGLYSMSIITALTAQNTTGVQGIAPTDPAFVAKQTDSVFSDIRPDAIKIGMLANAGVIRAVAEKLREHEGRNIVLDPVMVASSGAHLFDEEAVSVLKEDLISLADVITPNIREAEVLSGISIRNREEAVAAAAEIGKWYGGAILITGGHFSESSDDLLYRQGESTWFCATRIDNPNNHGTGCTFSSALACNMALGYELTESVRRAKDYVRRALALQLDLGRGSGPLGF
ncbi:hydroxymethylpyrimidine/phosphomethylpyrimidine kinase [Clostridia bacterium]|nr:hydroxymethylpyrimidine/phosphomethylpyrimidine kinase [Clostridia bacterium]